MQTTTLPLAFTADGFGGISSDFDKAHFECVATYKEARNGILKDLPKSTRWPADDQLVRVLRKFPWSKSLSQFKSQIP